MSIVLGIDGGGTKTTGVIARNTGEVLAEVTVGATNPNSVTSEKVKKELSLLLEKLKEYDDIAYSRINHIFAGIAGASHKKTRCEIREMIQDLTEDNFPVTVNHDAINALYSGTLGEAGIVQIAGTGSVTYGITKEGKEGRVGGWGHLFSDHGSGYAIGRDALEKVFLAHDGYPIETSLTNKVLAELKVETVPHIIRQIYHRADEKTLVASLSKIVFEAADEGDSQAKEILWENGEKLGYSIKTLLEKLFSQSLQSGEDLLVVLVGGLFNRLDMLKEPLYNGLGEYQEIIRLKSPEIPAAAGSVIAALGAENISVSDEFIENYNKKRE